MNVKNLGLEELSINEAKEVNGGWLWIPIAIGMLLIAEVLY